MSDNLSAKWAKMFIEVSRTSHKRISPYIFDLHITKGNILENEQVKELLNDTLRKKGLSEINTVANTIFPASYWNHLEPKENLYSKYKKNWPKISKDFHNSNGTYFQRMIMYNCSFSKEEDINQLNSVIDAWKKGVRRSSAFKIAIYDPRIDQKNTPYQLFPCLQQISIVPNGRNGKDGLAVIGYYATQTSFEKAYGNYLGLCRLGQFLAYEMGIDFVRMICFTSVLLLSSGKLEVNLRKNLVIKLEKLLKYYGI